MRDTFEWIDEATGGNPPLRHALYDLAAQQLAAQALPIAFARWMHITKDDARLLIEEVAGYPGVTGRKMTSTSELRVGDRAYEIFLNLARLRQSFLRE